MNADSLVMRGQSHQWRLITVSIVLYWAPLIGWMMTIFLLSNTTASTIESTTSTLPLALSESIITKATVVHALEFGILAVLFYRLLLSYRIDAPLLLWLGASLLTVSYGVTDEIHQAFVPGRVVSITDVGFDALGALIGVGVAQVTARLVRFARSLRQVAV